MWNPVCWRKACRMLSLLGLRSRIKERSRITVITLFWAHHSLIYRPVPQKGSELSIPGLKYCFPLVSGDKITPVLSIFSIFLCWLLPSQRPGWRHCSFSSFSVQGLLPLSASDWEHPIHHQAQENTAKHSSKGKWCHLTFGECSER